MEGSHRIKVTCYASQDPDNPANAGNGERSLGKLLIPQRYTLFEASGLTADVHRDGVNDFELRLTSAP